VACTLCSWSLIFNTHYSLLDITEDSGSIEKMFCRLKFNKKNIIKRVYSTTRFSGTGDAILGLILGEEIVRAIKQ
jgi:hypothetical protein